MTTSPTPERLAVVMAWLVERAQLGLPAPTNTELARIAGMGAQRFQPWDRPRGVRSKKAEAGAVLLYALEQMGRVQVARGPNWRRIFLVQERLFLEPGFRGQSAGRYPSR